MKKLLLLLLFALPCSAQIVGPISITSAQCATIGTFNQAATVGIYVAGTFTGTLQPQGTIQGQAAFNLQVTPSTSSLVQSTITATGAYVARVAGLSSFQLCGNTVTVGTAIVYLNLSTAPLSSTATTSSGITGSGTANTIAKFTAGTVIGNSSVTDDGAIITFGNTGPLVKGSLGADATLTANTLCTPTNTAASGSSVECITYGPTDTASGNKQNLDLTMVPQPAGASSASFSPLRFQLSTASAMAQNLATLRGILGGITLAGSGNVTRATGIESSVFSSGTTGTIADLQAMRLRASFLSGANTPTNLTTLDLQATGFNANPTSPITITNDIQLRIGAPNLQANGTLTHHAGIQINGTQTGGTGNADGWSIFDNSPTTNKSQLGLLTVNSLGNIGASTLGTTGQTIVDATGLLTKYTGITTAGLGFPVQVARVRAVAQAAAITTTTLLATGAANTDYLVVATVYCTATSAAATAALTISYTDPGSQAQTITPSAAACTALGATSFSLVNSPIVAKTGTNITYAVAIANTPTYDIRIDLYQLGTN